MYPLCYFVMTVNLNKRLTSILREVNINGYNTCILSIIGAAYLYIWGAFKPYDTKAQITHQLSKVFCTYAKASSVIAKGEEYPKRIDFSVAIGYLFYFDTGVQSGCSE